MSSSSPGMALRKGTFAFVAAGVGRRGVGSDNGAGWGIPALSEKHKSRRFAEIGRKPLLVTLVVTVGRHPPTIVVRQ